MIIIVEFQLYTLKDIVLTFNVYFMSTTCGRPQEAPVVDLMWTGGGVKTQNPDFLVDVYSGCER